MGELPPPRPGTALRILATSDLGAVAVPMRTSHGLAGTCAGVAALLEGERERVAAEWFDVGDLVVGNPAYVLTGERPWEDVAGLPIAVTTAGNHEFDDGLDALQASAARLSYPMLCANADVGLPATAVVGDVGVIGLTHPRCPDLSRCPALRDDLAGRARRRRDALRVPRRGRAAVGGRGGPDPVRAQLRRLDG